MPIQISAQAAAFHTIAFPMVAKQVLKRVVVVSFLLSLWLIPQAARGQTLYWDLPGGANPTPSGPWDTTSANWSANSVGGAQTTWNNNSNAVFSASALGATGNYTVTVTENLALRDLTYTGGNLGSTLQIAVVGGHSIFNGTPQMNVSVDAGTTLVQ
jgi:hypothetical protein